MRTNTPRISWLGLGPSGSSNFKFNLSRHWQLEPQGYHNNDRRRGTACPQAVHFEHAWVAS